MNLKAVRLLLISFLLFSVISAAPVFLTAHRENVLQTNLDPRPETDGSSPMLYVGDPVGGGIPCAVERGTGTEKWEV